MAGKSFGKKKGLVLVTGGTGRLGRLVVKELLRRGNAVRLLVRDVGPARELFGKPKAGRLEFVAADLEEPKSGKMLEDAMRGVEKVVHLAALVDYGAPKSLLMKVNAGATQRLADAAKAAKVKKFVFAGSTSVYRKAVYLPIDEKHPFAPMNAYGESKMEAEKRLKQSGVPFVILRMSMVYGPGFTEGFGQVIEAVKKGRMMIIGSGENRIAFVNAKDAVCAVVKALDSKIANEDFIITGKAKTQRQCFEEIARQAGVPAPEKKVPVAVALAFARLEELKARISGKKPKIRREYVHTLADDRWFSTKKAGKSLGWEPKIGLRQGLRQMLAPGRRKGF